MATTCDGQPSMLMFEKPRKYSISSHADTEEIEKITFPPSTELIQDEYKHEDNKMGLVYIFYSTLDTESMELLTQELNDQGYEVPPENTIKITTRTLVLNALQSIALEDNSDKTCLMIFILGNSIGDDLILPEDEPPNADWKNCVTVKDVWINFTGNHCESLRNKPKLFVFQGSQKFQAVQFDSHGKQIQIKTKYGFPAEADMLVVYNKVESSRRNLFILHFCNNLHDFGKEDDVIGIVTRFQHQDQRPLIISTFTRKFFISPHTWRGHHYEYDLNYESLGEMVNTLNNKIDSVIDYISNCRRISGQKRNSPNELIHVVDGPSRGTPALSVSGSRKSRTSVSSTKSNTRVPQKLPWRY